MLSPKKKETLTQLLGAERVAEIEAGTKTMEDAAKAAGVDYKSIAEEEEEPTAEATKEVPSQEEQLGQLVDQLGLKELSTLIEGFQGTIAGLEQRIKTLEAATEEHKQSDDAKVAKALEPKAAKFLFAWQNAASKSQDTELKADDAKDAALKTAAPSANFFEQMVGSLAKGSDIS